MNTKATHSVQLTRKQASFLVVAWLLIALKCLLITWAVDRWNIPFAAGWVVYPTLAFALLATVLWLRPGSED